MSFKIRTAYKLTKNSDLWPLAHDIRVTATQKVQTNLRRFYKGLLGDVMTDSPEFKAKLAESNGDEINAKLSIVRKVVHDGYRSTSTQSERSIFDFDVSIAIRKWKGKTTLIPYCDMVMRDALDFLADDPRLEDFHYQNQSDRPASISEEEWVKRRRYWMGMDKAGAWDDLFILEVCSWGMFYRIDPLWEMSAELRRETGSKKS